MTKQIDRSNRPHRPSRPSKTSGIGKSTQLIGSKGSNRPDKSAKPIKLKEPTKATGPNRQNSQSNPSKTNKPGISRKVNKSDKTKRPITARKSALWVNIDTVVFSVKEDKDGSFNIPNTSKAVVISEHGEVLNAYQNRVRILGKHGTHTLAARTKNSGKVLTISGSPYAYLHGQNVYTASDMQTATYESLKAVRLKLGLKSTKAQRKKWREGDIYLERVDLAINIRVDSERKVISTLGQIRRQLEEQRGATRTNGTTVYWAPKNGKEYSISFYAKGPQMRQQKRFMALLDRDQLLEECETILRVELRLQAHELRKLGLDKVSAWDDQTAEKVIRQYLREKIKLFSVTSGLVTKKELSKLPSRLRAVLALHKSGVELTDIYPKRTLQRHRSDFKKLGVDLLCPNQKKGAVIPLKTVISPRTSIKEAPEWMVKAELVPV
jgi:II/X family phage/plasmid replication protein